MKSSLLYVTELTTAVLLSSYQVARRGNAGRVFERFKHLGLPDHLWIDAVSGLILGLSFAGRASASVLLPYVKQYQEHLARLNAENRARLARFAREVIQIMEAWTSG